MFHSSGGWEYEFMLMNLKNKYCEAVNLFTILVDSIKIPHWLLFLLFTRIGYFNERKTTTKSTRNNTYIHVQ